MLKTKNLYKILLIFVLCSFLFWVNIKSIYIYVIFQIFLTILFCLRNNKGLFLFLNQLFITYTLVSCIDYSMIFFFKPCDPNQVISVFSLNSLVLLPVIPIVFFYKSLLLHNKSYLIILLSAFFLVVFSFNYCDGIVCLFEKVYVVFLNS